MSSRTDLAFSLPGGIPRLPIQAGAMVASAIPDLSGAAFDRAIPILGNLSPSQIFSFRSSLKFKAAALGLSSLGLGAIMLFDDQISKGKKITLGIAGLCALLATEGIVAKELLYSESLFSIDPLINLLGRELHFNAIFNSDIEIQVLVADMNRPGECMFSNHDSQNCSQRWLNILRATSRLPGKFPFIVIDGKNMVDGEVWTDFPITQLKRYRRVVRFDYWSPLQPEPSPRVWISDLTRSFDIMRDRCTQKKMEFYEYERKVNPSLPDIFNIRLSQKLFAQMPQMKIHSFTPDDMKAMMNIGYQAVIEQGEAIKHYLDTGNVCEFAA